jgi:hypothetical protein
VQFSVKSLQVARSFGVWSKQRTELVYVQPVILHGSIDEVFDLLLAQLRIETVSHLHDGLKVLVCLPAVVPG